MHNSSPYKPCNKVQSCGPSVHSCALYTNTRVTDGEYTSAKAFGLLKRALGSLGFRKICQRWKFAYKDDVNHVWKFWKTRLYLTPNISYSLSFMDLPRLSQTSCHMCTIYSHVCERADCVYWFPMVNARSRHALRVQFTTYSFSNMSIETYTRNTHRCVPLCTCSSEHCSVHNYVHTDLLSSPLSFSPQVKTFIPVYVLRGSLRKARALRCQSVLLSFSRTRPTLPRAESSPYTGRRTDREGGRERFEFNAFIAANLNHSYCRLAAVVPGANDSNTKVTRNVSKTCTQRRRSAQWSSIHCEHFLLLHAAYNCKILFHANPTFDGLFVYTTFFFIGVSITDANHQFCPTLSHAFEALLRLSYKTNFIWQDSCFCTWISMNPSFFSFLFLQLTHARNARNKIDFYNISSGAIARKNRIWTSNHDFIEGRIIVTFFSYSKYCVHKNCCLCDSSDRRRSGEREFCCAPILRKFWRRIFPRQFFISEGKIWEGVFFLNIVIIHPRIDPL